MMYLKSSTLNRQGGFTLLEVMIALFVFTVGILAVALMQLRAINGNASAQRQTEATAQAQEVIERIIQQPFAAFAVGTTDEDFGSYHVKQVISVAPAASKIAGALVISVTVSWTEGGRQRNIPLSFIKSLDVEKSYGF